MKVLYMKEDGKHVAAYHNQYEGFEFVYVLNKEGKELLFENRLAIHGIWLNDKQISEMIQPIINAQYKYTDTKMNVISAGDKIRVESYKHRGIGVYGEDGHLKKQTPDCIRELNVIDENAISESIKKVEKISAEGNLADVISILHQAESKFNNYINDEL